jgi:hypothetical protein
MPTDRLYVLLDPDTPATKRVLRLARQWGISRSQVTRILIREALLARQRSGQESGAA